MGIMCPICKKGNYEKLMCHITKVHNLTKKEFLVLYPNHPTITESCSKNISQKLKINWNDDEYRKNQNEKLIKNWEDSEYRKKQSKSRKESWDNNPERQANFRKWFWSDETNEKRNDGVRKSLEDPDVLNARKEQFAKASKSEKRLENLNKVRKTDQYKKNVGISSKRAWENNDQRRQDQSKLMSNLWEVPETREMMLEKKIKPGKHEYISVTGEKLFLRSNWELDVIKELEQLDVEYKFEPERFDYYIKGKKHKYTPDFYLNKYNVYIEVKPSTYLNHPINIAKWDSVIDSGNELLIITENELTSIPNLIKLLEEGSEIMAMYASRVQENSKQEASK